MASAQFNPPRPAEAAASEPTSPVAQTSRTTTPVVRDDGAPGRRALHGPLQDNAVYNCECGYVFEAAVSTSVACPHCGGDQAW